MELEPHFFALVQMQVERDSLGRLSLSPVKSPKEKRRQILGYYRIRAADGLTYTLVKWRIQVEGELFEGETLFSGTTLENTRVLASGGGEIPLWQPSNSTEQSRTLTPGAIAKQLDNRLGLFGLPPALAVQLRQPKNYRTFQL